VVVWVPISHRPEALQESRGLLGIAARESCDVGSLGLCPQPDAAFGDKLTQSEWALGSREDVRASPPSVPARQGPAWRVCYAAEVDSISSVPRGRRTAATIGYARG
jgi:hypothetical protein